MFHAPMGRFQLELINYFTYISIIVPSSTCVFLSCRPFVVNTTTSTQDLKNIGKTSDTQKANPNSLNTSLTKNMKRKQLKKLCP